MVTCSVSLRHVYEGSFRVFRPYLRDGFDGCDDLRNGFVDLAHVVDHLVADGTDGEKDVLLQERNLVADLASRRLVQFLWKNQQSVFILTLCFRDVV